MVTRRSFLGQFAATSFVAQTNLLQSTSSTPDGSTYVELLRPPDNVCVFSGLDRPVRLEKSGERFSAGDISITARPSRGGLSIRVLADKTALTHACLRWHGQVSPKLLFLGDQWERSYGDLAWRGMAPERVMPWYFASYDGSALHSYGVETGAGSFCFWQADPEGITLWLDLCNGGEGVQLGGRELDAAAIVSRRGTSQEPAVAALRAFCRQMCSSPGLPKGPVYGGNDWYCAYGKNSEEMLLRITDLIADVSPPSGERPFTVVDMGWKDGTPEFPSMAEFCSKIRKREVRPGVWIRPLEAAPETHSSLLLPDVRYGNRTERFAERAYDPTIQDAQEKIIQKMRELRDWGFDLVKHDFSAYDLFGQWGFEMGARPTNPGWHFHDRSRTNAEIVLDLYRLLRATLGENIQILGCNTFGHLGAGIFEIQRTGDDTSGRIWERTRRMGVNTLAHRLPQHRTFFHLDPDCVGVTPEVPWELNRQWLDLVASTGTALFISPAQGAVGKEQRDALKSAFALVNAQEAAAEPVDVFHETSPETWRMGSATKRYRWSETEGNWPFTV